MAEPNTQPKGPARARKPRQNASEPANLVDTTGAMVEELLEPLLRQFGIERVLSDLQVLIGHARWSDYQRVYAIARNVNNRIQRKEAE